MRATRTVRGKRQLWGKRTTYPLDEDARMVVLQTHGLPQRLVLGALPLEPGRAEAEIRQQPWVTPLPSAHQATNVQDVVRHDIRIFGLPRAAAKCVDYISLRQKVQQDARSASDGQADKKEERSPCKNHTPEAGVLLVPLVVLEEMVHNQPRDDVPNVLSIRSLKCC